MLRPEDLEHRAHARVGQVLLGKWQIERLLDVGGMASVFAAIHRNGKRVAIKMLHPGFADDQQVKDRFLREGYVANRIGHPDAVQILDDDVLEDGSVFLVMELLEGQSLETRLRQQRTLPVRDVLQIADSVLDVLGAAHDQGIVHRDIKPANLFLTSEGAVKVLDFGLARVRERTFKGSMTRSGMVIGTASYMPPEQARGKKDLIDARTDIWALGATMFRALAGRYVHLGQTVNERLIAAMSEHAPSLASAVAGVPDPLVRIVDQALAFQPADRWPSARAMQQEIRRVHEQIAGFSLPASRRTEPLGPAPTDPNPPRFQDSIDIHVSVVFEPSTAGDSIIVEVEDDSGRAGRFEMRRRGTPTPSDPEDEPLSEVTVIEVTEGSKV